MLATNPTMIMLMHGGMVSAMTAVLDSSHENASANAIGTPITRLATNPATSKKAGVTACVGTVVFQPHTASASPRAAANVAQTYFRRPSRAAAVPNTIISRLPATTGQM